jgi:PiT family inorganic phosphate transporter
MTDQASQPVNQWKTLDKDPARLSQLESASAAIGRPVVATGIAFAFVVLCALPTGQGSGTLIIAIAAAFGA